MRKQLFVTVVLFDECNGFCNGYKLQIQSIFDWDVLWEMSIKIGPLRIDTILSGRILTDLCR